MGQSRVPRRLKAKLRIARRTTNRPPQCDCRLSTGEFASPCACGTAAPGLITVSSRRLVVSDSRHHARQGIDQTLGIFSLIVFTLN